MSELRPFVPNVARIGELEIEHQGQAAELVQASHGFEVKNDKDLGRCADLVNKIDAVFKAVEVQRDSYTRPLFEGQRNFNNHFKIVTGPLKSCEQRLLGMMKAYEQHQKAIRDKEAAEQAKAERARQREAKKAGEAPPPPPPPVQAAPVHGDMGGKTQLREKWEYELDDLTLVPLKYLIPDDRAIKAAIAGKDGLREIPGLKIFDAGSMKTR